MKSPSTYRNTINITIDKSNDFSNYTFVRYVTISVKKRILKTERDLKVCSEEFLFFFIYMIMWRIRFNQNEGRMKIRYNGNNENVIYF